MENPEDFDSFMKNVDKISELVKDLNSPDVDVQKEAMEKSERYIAAQDEPCRSKVNKTKINTHPSVAHPPPSTLQYERPDNFMKFMENDAEERRLRRDAREKKATALKDKGNQAFAQGDYETAVSYYGEGLTERRDMQPLYTNRAQAFIKLGKYQEAISDCEWALKCDERCVKAYLHMGKAFSGLKKYKESRTCFERIVEIEPEKEKMMKVYLTQVDLEERRESQEAKAMQELEEGEEKTTIVPRLLEKLSRPGQTPLYYCGGFEILSQAVSQCTGQTLFRLNHGFRTISSNETVRSCLLQERRDRSSEDLCASVLKLWRVVCRGNEENQKMLMTCGVGRDAIVGLAASERDEVKTGCLELLSVFAETPHGRRLSADHLDVPVLTKNLLESIFKLQRENSATNILENFTAEKKFCIQLRDALKDSVILTFSKILRNIGESNQRVVPSLLSSVGRLARDDVIRHRLAHDPECWASFLVAINRLSGPENPDVLHPLLGLIINLSAVSSPVVRENAVSLSDCCLKLLRNNDEGIVNRAAGVLSVVLPQNPEAVQHVVQRKVVRTMCRLLKGAGPTATKYFIKTLTLCTAASRLGREELLKSDKKLTVLRRLLATSCDEMVSGNAALCLAHCLELEGTGRSLLGSDIVLVLLRHAAGDAQRTDVQRNAAVALGRLCLSEPRHRNKLRELHGLEILHSCVELRPTG